ncbi:MAG TPA: hypothetical protein VF518_08850, partial [Polyangia bacterium]
MTDFLADSVKPTRIGCASIGLLLTAACGHGKPVAPPAAPAVVSPANSQFRLRQCSDRPIPVPGPPGVQQSRGCVATFTQELTNPAAIRAVGAKQVERR